MRSLVVGSAFLISCKVYFFPLWAQLLKFISGGGKLWLVRGMEYFARKYLNALSFSELHFRYYSYSRFDLICSQTDEDNAYNHALLSIFFCYSYSIFDFALRKMNRMLTTFNFSH